MIFGEIPVSEAEGVILARSIAGLKKGQNLTAEHITQLQRAGIDFIRAARLESGDVPENDAANMIAAQLTDAHIQHAPAAQGRIHFYSRQAGLMLFDEKKITALNHVGAEIAFACLAPFTPVMPQQLIATLKIIPFACAQSKIAAACALAAQAHFHVSPFQPRIIALICTQDSSKKNMSAKAEAITRQRVEKLGSRLHVVHCEDQSAAITEKLKSTAADLILIHGASAIMDERDIIPRAIEQAGGRLIHFGMPTDPGNLLLLAEYQHKPVVGLPGCARSPLRNGFDLVLERLICGLDVSGDDIMNMGIGGLMLGANIDSERYG